MVKSSFPWTKFFWDDWERDPSLRLCSLAAQGLWMRLLCLCAKADPVGYLTVEGQTPNHDDLALLIGRPAEELLPLIDELSERGVFSRDGKGRIYSRRMVRDAKLFAEARKAGLRGGNPNLLKDRGKAEGVNPPDNGRDKPKNPESRIQKRITPESPPAVFDGGTENASKARKQKAVVFALGEDWALPEDWKEIPLSRGWKEGAVSIQAMKFRQYFGFGKGSDVKRSEKGWRQSWLNWLDRALKIDPDAATKGQTESVKMPASHPPLPQAVRGKLQGHFTFNESFIQRWLAPCAIDLNTGEIETPSRFHADFLETHYGSALEHALGCRLTFTVRPVAPMR